MLPPLADGLLYCLRQLVLIDDCRRPPLQGLGNEGVSVDVDAGEGKEKASGTCGAGVKAEAGDDDVVLGQGEGRMPPCAACSGKALLQRLQKLGKLLLHEGQYSRIQPIVKGAYGG